MYDSDYPGENSNFSSQIENISEQIESSNKKYLEAMDQDQPLWVVKIIISKMNWLKAEMRRFGD